MNRRAALLVIIVLVMLIPASVIQAKETGGAGGAAAIGESPSALTPSPTPKPKPKKKPAPAIKDLSAPGGIGATRASFDLTYGAPTSDTFDDLNKQQHTDEALYDVPNSEGVTVDVLFVVNKDNKERGGDRAYDLIISAPSGSWWSLVDANIIADVVLPKDSKPEGDLAPVPDVATASFDWEEQSFKSSFMAKVVPDKRWYFNEVVGEITVSLQPSYPGQYNQIQVSTDAG